MLYKDFPIIEVDARSIWCRSLVLGVGINDANYQTQPRLNGKQIKCPIYRKWAHMLDRCYSEKWRSRNVTYLDCILDKRWHSFMAFREWVLSQPFWEGYHLDKDLLISGNKIYGPDTCIFVSQEVNSFMTENKVTNSGLPLGVTDLKNGFYRVYVSNGTGKNWHSNMIDDIELASLIYEEKKLQFAELLSYRQADERVARALIERYSFRHRK